MGKWRRLGTEKKEVSLAGVVGIEPTLQVLETRGLPLTDTPMLHIIPQLGLI